MQSIEVSCRKDQVLEVVYLAVLQRAELFLCLAKGLQAPIQRLGRIHTEQTQTEQISETESCPKQRPRALLSVILLHLSDIFRQPQAVSVHENAQSKENHSAYCHLRHKEASYFLISVNKYWLQLHLALIHRLLVLL